ncbi:hypothetical protein K501DRAFT_258093 [Backusella circina FSU 941]|nr:hypothetical protein K501DRAFT_258093 [Backusella circina FSU 941]
MSKGAHYEGIKMVTAYLVSIKNNFGKCLRRVVNHVLSVRVRKEAIREEMEGGVEEYTEEEIRERIRAEVTAPAANFKTVISHNRPNDVPAEFQDAYALIEPLIRYPQDYVLAQNNIYYDSKANPENHFKNYFLMCQYLEGEEGVNSYKCFPTRTSYIPSYTTIDTTILRETILNLPRINAQNTQNMLNAIYNEYNPFPTIQNMPQQQLIDLDSDVAFFDPGRKDLLFGMHCSSHPDNKITYRYTRNTRALITGMKEARNQRRNIPQQVLDDFQVDAIQAQLQETNGSNTTLLDFNNYLHVKNFASPLYNFYALYTPEGNTYPLFRKLRLSACCGKVKERDHIADSIRDRLNTNNLIVGNWTAPMARYHEPIKGKGMLKILQRSGFNIMLIDEFKTSTFCPNCGIAAEKPFNCLNPRPYRRRALYPFIKCHGLLSCSSPVCFVVVNGVNKRRVWNRDLLAVLNFLIIFRSLQLGLGIPERFIRANQ